MKHLDKILPLSILAVNLLFVINSLYSKVYILVFNIIIDSREIVLIINILSILVLIIFTAFSFIKKFQFKKKFAIYILLISFLFPIFSLNMLNNYRISSAYNCDGNIYYLVAVNSVMVSPLPAKPGVFRPEVISETYLTILDKGSILRKIEISSLTNSEIKDFQECI